MAFISKVRQDLVCTSRSDILKDSDLQVLSISANGISSILLLNIYNEKSQQDNNDQWTIDRCLTAIQLPSRAIICEDFNAHHAWWNFTVENPIRSISLINWLEIQNCELLNTPEQNTYTHHSENSTSVIDLTFATPSLCGFIKNWQVNEDLNSGSDHEVIQFELTGIESEWVNSPLNAAYNIAKADWVKFAQTLQLDAIIISRKIANTSNLKEMACLLRNLIADTADQHIPKKKLCARAKVWWSHSLSTLRSQMGLSKKT